MTLLITCHVAKQYIRTVDLSWGSMPRKWKRYKMGSCCNALFRPFRYIRRSSRFHLSSLSQLGYFSYSGFELVKSMAQSDPKQQTEIEESEKKLKYLDFVQLAAIYAVVCLSSIYEYAKENSGPLKPGVQTVEGTVKTVIGPVYDKFHDVPFQLLKFVDRKVDDSLSELDRHVPSLVKQASSQARAVASEVQRAGVLDAAKTITRTVYTKYEPTAKELYNKYEPVAEQYAVSAWRSLNRLPLFHQVAQTMVPTAAYWSEKYNQVVYQYGEKGYATASYLPLIPTDRIAKVFEEGGRVPAVSTSGGSVLTQ